MNDTHSTTTTTLDLLHTGVANEADWALAGIPDSINATGLLAEDLEEYGGQFFDSSLLLNCTWFFYENSKRHSYVGDTGVQRSKCYQSVFE